MQIKRMLRPLSSDFCLTIFAPTSAFHAFGHQSSSDFPSDFFEGDPKPTRRNTEQPWEKGRSWSGISRVMLSCLAIVSMFSLSAQTPRKDSGANGLIPMKALNIGDKIPQSLWDTPLHVVNHPTGQNTIKLSEYRNKKLIILDFWAVWCASCVESLGKIQHKLNYNQSDIAFIPVTSNADSVVTKFQHSNKVAGEWQFPLVVGDKLLKQLFQHSSISHFVWLSNDGTVLAFTSSEYITDSQLQKGLEGDFADVKMKIDQIDFNVNQPLLVAELADSKGQYTGFRTFLTGVVPTSGLQSLDSLGLTRRYFVNTTLRSLCMDAMTGIKGVKLAKKKIVYDVEDQNIYFNKMQGNADVWNQKHGLCYEAILPGMIKPSGFRATLKEDLQRHFNIKLTIEERPISVIVLSPGVVKSATPTDESIELKSLIYSLNLTDNVIPYVICPVDMESVKVPQRLKEYTSPKQFIEMMAKYGVKAQQCEQYQQVLVITERRGA